MERVSFVKQVLKSVLKPIVRLAVQNSVRFQDVSEILKESFIEAAYEELGCDANKSKVSLLTGVHRKDINRLAGSERKSDKDLPARVIGGWLTSAEYRTKAGSPKVLSQTSFSELVQSISTDVSPRAVGFELLRVKAIEETPRGFKLCKEEFVPPHDIDAGCHYLETDVSDLMNSVLENLLEEVTSKNLHLKTEYTKVPTSSLEEVKHWILVEGSKFHKKVRSYLSDYDLDINPTKEPVAESRVAVLSFSITEDNEKNN